jgi:hypothetical protein
MKPVTTPLIEKGDTGNPDISPKSSRVVFFDGVSYKKCRQIGQEKK